MKSRTDETVQLRRELHEQVEVLQQKEIDISCLRGQVEQTLNDLESAVKAGVNYNAACNDSDSDSDTMTACSNESDVLVDELDMMNL